MKTTFKGILGSVIILGLVGLGVYELTNDEPQEETVIVKENMMKIEPFYTLPVRTDALHTPENILIDFMTFWNKQDWNAMSQISNNWTAQRLQDHFFYYNLEGYRFVEQTKVSKAWFEIEMEYTYYVIENKPETKKVTVRLFLADDYVTWLVNPLTTL